MKKKINVFIIGAGRIAGLNELDKLRLKPASHVGAYMNNSIYNICGVYDKDKISGKKFSKLFKIKYYHNLQKGLLEADPNHISIAVPYKENLNIIEIVLKFTKNLKSILCEKPISNSIKSALKIHYLCEKNKVKLFVNNRRLMTHHQEIKKIIKNKFNGHIIEMNACCSSGLHAIGTHMIELIFDICGDPEWVIGCKVKNNIKKLPYSMNYHKNDPTVFSISKFQNEIKVFFSNTAETLYSMFEFKIILKDGIIESKDNLSKIIYRKFIKPKRSTLSYKLSSPVVHNYKEIPLFKIISDHILSNYKNNFKNYNHSPLNSINAIKSYNFLSKILVSYNNSSKKITFKNDF